MSEHVDNLRRGFNWLGSASIIARVVDFSTVLLLLTLLSKEQIGTASIVLSVGMVVEAVNELGIGESLLQSRAASRLQLDSACWLVMVTAFVLAGIVIAASPLVEAAYSLPGMALLFIPIAAKQPLVAAALLPLTLLNRELKYERIAVINVAATLGAALTRLVLALAGAGPWALVIGFSAHALFVLAGAQLSRPYWPRMQFDRLSVRPLLNFGLSAAASNAFQQLFKNVDFLLIGWIYGPAQLAVYRLAFDIAMEPAVAVGDLINRTSFPVFSMVLSVGDDLKPSFLWSLRRLTMIVAPLMAALALVAVPLTGLIHDSQGQSYAAAALPLQILAFAALLRVLLQVHYPLLLASGRAVTALALSAVTLLLLCAGILAAGLNLPPDTGIVAVSAVWLLVYPPLLIWSLRDLRRVCDIRLRDLAGAFTVPAVAVGSLVGGVFGGVALLRLLAASADPRLQIGVIVAAAAAVYAGIFLHARGQQPGPLRKADAEA